MSGERCPSQTSIDRSDHLPIKTKENGNDLDPSVSEGITVADQGIDEVEVLERHTSLDRDSGSFFTEVAKTVADPTFPGPVVSDDDHKRWGLSQRSHTPPPFWTPSFPQLHEHHVDVPVTPKREEVTHSLVVSRDHVSEPLHLASSSRIIDLPLPVFPRISLPRLSLSPSGIG